VGEYQSAVNIIRKGARWLEGRYTENDPLDLNAEDREFDVEGFAREGSASGNEDAVVKAGSKTFHLDINLRERLAVSRLRLGDFVEAKVSYVLSVISFHRVSLTFQIF
jgi:hypothetical protein